MAGLAVCLRRLLPRSHEDDEDEDEDETSARHKHPMRLSGGSCLINLSHFHCPFPIEFPVLFAG